MFTGETEAQFPFGKAVTLAERVTALNHPASRSLQQNDNELGQTRLSRWQTQSPFTEADLFAERLALTGLSEEQFLWHLGVTQPILSGEKQAWQLRLETIFQQYDATGAPFQLPQSVLERFPQARFLQAFQPFLQDVRRQLHRSIAGLHRQYATLPFQDEVAAQQLFHNIPPQLVQAIGRTLVLELNIARLEERLQGETAEARFQDFIDTLGHPDRLAALFDEYPVLARVVTILTTQWAANFAEFLEHLCQDRPALEEMFGELGTLEAVNLGAGDRHHEGRTVGIVRFSSGLQLVYKPRGLAIDAHFQQLLTWLNRKGNPFPFRTLSLLDREDHGWVEFVSTHACHTEEQIRNFYRRQGAFLALLHALSAYDFHYENLIAAGEHPVLIDLETLFSPSFISKDTDLSADARAMVDSVMSIGLLPRRIWVGEEQEGIDLSGLGMQEGQLTPHGVPIWRNAITDKMRFARERMRISGRSHQPTLQNNSVHLIDYVDEICEGFTQLYGIMVQHRADLVDFLRCFGSDRIRCVVRPTRTYALMLMDSVHPDLMRDALARDQFFDKLWIGTVGNEKLRRLLPYEQEDMWRSDVPFFTTYPNSVDIWSSDGRRIPDYFDESGLDRVTRKVVQLDADDMARQLWLIRASLATVNRMAHRPQKQFGYISADRKDRFAPSPARLVQTATAVAERIKELALDLEDTPAWFGISHNMAGQFFTVDPIRYELYGGTSGIALFFAYLGKYAENNEYTKLARLIASELQKTAKTLLEDSEAQPIPIGGFEGWGGIVYTFTHLGLLWGEPEFLASAVVVSNLLVRGIPEDDVYDIISGAAGCIGALLALYRVNEDETVLAAARQCGDHLLANALETDHGLAWRSRESVVIKTPLTGFSHGVAGIAWALLRLTEVTGDNRYAIAAKKSLVYERTFFSPEHQNWCDLRDHSALGEIGKNASKYATLWCHGAPGIGMARLDTLHLLDDATVRQEIESAIQTTLQSGFGKGHCLCHGDVGNIELLLQARKHLGSQWNTDIARLTENILTGIEEHGLLCGNPLSVEEPGLMTGLAGIGYGLLRLAYPHRIPSVLLLEPPLR